MKHFKAQLLGLTLVTALFVFTSCTKNEPEVEALPEGVQTLTGTLLSTDLSLLRRGTHVIRIDGEEVYYVESSQVNLRRYEQKQIVIQGTLEENADPQYLPVLVATNVLDVLEEEWKSWNFPTLKLSLETPEDWRGIERGGRVGFRVPEWNNPIFSIDTEEDLEVVGGTPIVLDAKRAVRIVDEETGFQKVILEQPDESFLVFSFTPGEHPQASELREHWLKILQSVDFKDAGIAPSSEASSGSGSDATSSESIGQPCGGTAGILCPTGLYCDVTDLEENIGTCQKL